MTKQIIHYVQGIESFSEDLNLVNGTKIPKGYLVLSVYDQEKKNVKKLLVSPSGEISDIDFPSVFPNNSSIEMKTKKGQGLRSLTTHWFNNAYPIYRVDAYNADSIIYGQKDVSIWRGFPLDDGRYLFHFKGGLREISADKAESLSIGVLPGSSVDGQQASSNVGGIDLNPANLDLQIKRDGKGVPLPVWQQPLETMNIEGFIPVILNVVPVNVPLLLGFADIEGSSESAQGTDNTEDSDFTISRFSPFKLEESEKEAFETRA